MKVIINTGRRRLGVPGRPALILEPNNPVAVTGEQLDVMRKSRTVQRWLEIGLLVLADADNVPAPTFDETPQPKKPTGLVVQERRTKHKADAREEVKLPDGVSGQGVELNHLGGGWWEVWVNGFKVTDRNVRKAEAKSIASEYE